MKDIRSLADNEGTNWENDSKKTSPMLVMFVMYVCVYFYTFCITFGAEGEWSNENHEWKAHTEVERKNSSNIKYSQHRQNSIDFLCTIFYVFFLPLYS